MAQIDPAPHTPQAASPQPETKPSRWPSLVWRLVWILMLIPAVFAALLFLAHLRLDRRISGLAAMLFEAESAEPAQIITDADLADLPTSVQRWLQRVGVVGTERVKTVQLEQRGRIRQSEESGWLELAAQQHYRTEDPAFVWHARMVAGPFVAGQVYDTYLNGRGGVRARLLSLIPIADMTGPEADQGAALRYLNELTLWFPGAALSDYLTWEAIDDNSALVTMTAHGQEVSAVLTFSPDGDLVNFAADRYRDTPDGAVLTQWETPMFTYGEFDGLHLPTTGAGVWKLDEGDFTYIELELLGLEINPEVD